MIRLLSRHHPAANLSPPLPLCPAAGQRGRGGERGGEGLAEAQLPHVFQDGVSPFAPGHADDGGLRIVKRSSSNFKVGYKTPRDDCASVGQGYQMAGEKLCNRLVTSSNSSVGYYCRL